MSIEVTAFQQALKADDDQLVLDKYYYGRTSAKLTYEQEATLRRQIANRFEVAMRDVIITGSAKLGFTIVPKPSRPAFSPFGDTSDVDVAIISTSLFVRLWHEATNYSEEQGAWDNLAAFRKYLMRGWVRPDKLPPDPALSTQSEWFEFFRNLTASGDFGPYKIAAGIYYDESFWEGYAASALAKARQVIEDPL